jgi:NosR/NirI family transcriptional regulator, nitrous oxide reductase regulator
MTTHSSTRSKQARKKNRFWDRALGVIAIATIIIAWFIGAARTSASIEPYLQQILPDAERFEALSGTTFAAYGSNSPEELIGYITLGTANSYGGPMRVAVATNLEGEIAGITIIENKDTPSWVKRVLESDFITHLTGKSYADNFQLGDDVDGVSGATYTSNAIAESVLKGSREIASTQLGFDVPETLSPPIKFGLPEITLIALFAVGYFGHQRKFKYKKQARWLSMLTGLLVLGFMYTSPLTLAYINKFLMGFWPEWQTHLYWYLLIGGILFVFTVDNKNPYCEWFCPFGAAQECMGAIGGAKVRTPNQYRNLLKWTQRGLAWAAIIIALLMRNPGISSYEVFGTLFDFVGTSWQFTLLALVLIASLYLKRPWCNYLCPLRPIDQFIRLVRAWIKEQWQIIRLKTA